MNIVPYDGFYTSDQTGNGWWMRMAFLPVDLEMGLVCMQDVSFDVPNKELNPANELILGFVVGANAEDAVNQLANPTFDRTIGLSEVLLRMQRKFEDKDLLNVIIDTAKERNKEYLISAGEDYAFDNFICAFLKKVGFEERMVAGGSIVKLKV